MEDIRRRVDAVVKDPATAAALKPWYSQLCKRPCFHDEYLQAFNSPSCHLVDTGGKGVERIDETGVWVLGKHYDLDCLVFASGFEVGTPLERRAGFDTTGRNGIRLSAYWADGMQSLHGMHVYGFPNLFIMGVAQAGNLISNITHNLEEAARTIARVVAHALSTNASEVEVTEEAERRWVASLEGGMASFISNPDCTPGYYNNEGHPIGRREHLNMAGYPGGPVAFFEYLDGWRNDGKFRGLEFR
jgi:cation diffusion facilitator CzcD-associated flavoprotein CzcO